MKRLWQGFVTVRLSSILFMNPSEVLTNGRQDGISFRSHAVIKQNILMSLPTECYGNECKASLGKV
ncbi:CLUMA_CG018770, isoform A [Clunio marinus]|uniref:CLUMA_CG018770, isoform A n=1 Tax=Clunio marinus TaxID=568069 RepID=A0A1J1IZV9_9DIPT|nr:CLUMA_CG018770, isoform A [Clunio marinus]